MSDAKEIKTHVHPTTYLGLDEESKKVDGVRILASIPIVTAGYKFVKKDVSTETQVT